jgi:hypothetical protein
MKSKAVIGNGKLHLMIEGEDEIRRLFEGWRLPLPEKPFQPHCVIQISAYCKAVTLISIDEKTEWHYFLYSENWKGDAFTRGEDGKYHKVWNANFKQSTPPNWKMEDQ